MTTSDCRWCGDTGTVPGPDVPCPRCSPQSQGVPTGEVDIDLAVSRFLGRYGEPHRPWEEKDLVALLSERERLAYDMGRSQAAGDATCSGEWLSGSGGHRVFGGCNKPATWVETEGGAAACDEHLGQHVRRAAGDGWVDPAKSPPLVDTFAWVVWNGTVQRQPWEWVNTDEDEQLWHFDGHTLPADEVDAYLPLRLPAPPSDSGKGE